jgi:hypothetical protein
MPVVWLMAIGLTVGGLGILAFTSRGWRGARRPDLGWMSPEWLADFRAGSR